MKNKNIAVTIQNMVQYYSITYGIDALIKHGYNVDIYIFLFKSKMMVITICLIMFMIS